MAAAQLSCCGAPAGEAIGYRPALGLSTVCELGVTVTLVHRHYLQFEDVWDQPPDDRIWKLQVNSVKV